MKAARLALASAALLVAAVAAGSALDPAPDAAPAPLNARAVPLNPEDPAQTAVGRLRYLGGVELASRDQRFGGLSGMRFLPDGRLQAISDGGDWLTLRLVEQNGRLVGATGLEIARMAGPDRNPLRGKADSDAEALEIEPDGARLVAFERNHRVLAYAPDGQVRVIGFPDKPWLAALPENGGIEALARVGELRLFFAEDSPPGYNLVIQSRGRAVAYGRVQYAAPVGYKPTDAAALDDRTVLVLNRRFSPASGVSAVLVSVAVDADKLVIGRPQTIAELMPPVTVDNMEALAVRREGGRTFVYIASDDNFSPLQRTLILKFELTS